MSQPAMTTAQADAAIETKTAPRVTREGMEAKVASAEYWQPGGTTLTVCALRMRSGFIVVGKSAAASPDNFDPEIGKRVAYDHAMNQLWELEGYLLREELARNG